MGLEGDSTIESSSLATEKNDDFLPLPVFGIRVDYVLNPNLFLRMSLDYFEYNEDAVDAQVIDWGLAIEYDIWKNIGIGLSYGSFSIEGEDIEDNDSLNVDIEGFFVYSKFNF